MDEAALENYQNMHTAEERANFFKSIHLFPVCGHHRVEASQQLALETQNPKWLIWTNVKIVAPPAGEVWEDHLRLLGVYDNKPFGKRLSFYDTMVLARKKYEQSFMDPDRPGRFRKPEKKTAGEFQAWLGSVCDARSATARSNYSSFVNCSEQIWGLLVQLMLGQVKNPHEDRWHNLSAPSTLHGMFGLPDSMVSPILIQVINREIDIKTANSDMQKWQKEARCKKHVVLVAHQFRPQLITDVDWDFAHVLEIFPHLDLLWSKYLGFFKDRSKPHQSALRAMNADITYHIEFSERLASGTLMPTLKHVPRFLKVQAHPQIKLSYYRNQVFVLLNCTTENASQFLFPTTYGTFLLCFPSLLLHSGTNSFLFFCSTKSVPL